jgi:uncharacterized protein YecE (DUF72 family)
MAAGKIRVGISGRRYKGWRGKFYPEKLRQKDELPFVAETLPRFIRSQRAEGFRRWREETPDVFVFSSKRCPRFVTHLRRLRELQVPLANFFASGVLELGEKFASFLWQLPPNFKFDAERLATFFHCCREMQNLLLREHSVALVCADTVEWSRWMDVTSDFMYYQLHGSEEMYASGYNHDAIEQWAMFMFISTTTRAWDALALIERIKKIQSAGGG